MAKNFPVRELTQEEYNNLPVIKSVSIEAREKMEIGFKFKFEPSICSVCHQYTERSVICEVVEPLNAIENQVGGGMLGMGSRFINRYYAKIIPSKST